MTTNGLANVLTVAAVAAIFPNVGFSQAQAAPCSATSVGKGATDAVEKEEIRYLPTLYAFVRVTPPDAHACVGLLAGKPTQSRHPMPCPGRIVL